MPLQRHKKSSRIGCLDSLFGEEEKKPKYRESKKEVEKKKKEGQGIVRSKKRFDPDLLIGDHLSSNKKILSGGEGAITDGPSSAKQNRTGAKNSIFDPNHIGDISKVKDNREKTAEERTETARLRNGLKQKRLTEIAEHLSDTDTRKESTVHGVTPQRERSVNNPPMKRHISLFDQFEGKDDFAGVPNKTDGEVLTDNIKAKASNKKDRVPNTGTSTKRRVSSLFDSMLGDDSEG